MDLGGSKAISCGIAITHLECDGKYFAWQEQSWMTGRYNEDAIHRSHTNKLGRWVSKISGFSYSSLEFWRVAFVVNLDIEGRFGQ